MIGAAYLGPGQPVPRLRRASVRPLRRAPRHVLDLLRRRSSARFILSYPPTDYVVQRHPRPASASTWRSASSPSSSIVFVLGFFMASARPRSTSTSRSTTRNNVGAVGGLVGMIGGLGGFVLPIAVRRAQRSDRPLDELLHAAVRARLRLRCVWMHFAIRAMERGVAGEALRQLPELPEMQAIHEPEHVGALSGAVLAGLAAGGHGRSGRRPAARSPGATCGSRSRRCCSRSRSGWCGRSSSPSCRRSASSSPPTSCSGSRRCRASRARRCASSTPSWCRSSAAGCGRRSRPGR